MVIKGNLGIITGIILLGIILIGAVSASLIISNSEEVSERDLNKITNEAIDEICTYLQIKDAIGKYQMLNGQQKIQKIAILIKPIVSQNIDISKITIQISNAEEVYLLSYMNKDAECLGSHSLFSHPLWESLTTHTFSIIPIIDDDSSMTTHHIMNTNTDSGFIVMNIPEDITMKKGDSLQLTIRPAVGISRTITIEAPFTTANVVTLY